MPTSWTIGSAPNCDLRVDQPKVSGRHCRLVMDGRGYVLEDLNSTNGTYVNGVRLVGSVGVRKGDAITLGLVTPMPWPVEEATRGGARLRVGREADNDFVVDSPVVSGHHAQVWWEGGGRFFLEDLGSANGTAIGSPERRVDRAPLEVGDTVYLGNHPIAAIQLLARLDPGLVPTVPIRQAAVVIGRAPECDLPLDLPMISGRHLRVWREGTLTRIEDLGSVNGTFINGRRIDGATTVGAGDLVSLGSYTIRLAVQAPAGTIPADPAPLPLSEPAGPGEGLRWPGVVAALVGQAPVLAVGIVAGLGMAGSSRGVAAVLFGVSVAAVWFGLSSAVVLGVLGRERRQGGVRADSVLLAAVAALIQAALAWGVVAALAGMRGPWLWSLLLVALGSVVGVALGGLVVAGVARRALVVVACGLIMAATWLFGGGPGTLASVAPWARTVGGVVPSRWVFEGLLLLEAGARPGVEVAGAAVGKPLGDLAEDYFPAGTERMGPTADLWAVGLMGVGLAAAVAYLICVAAPASVSRTAPEGS